MTDTIPPEVADRILAAVMAELRAPRWRISLYTIQDYDNGIFGHVGEFPAEDEDPWVAYIIAGKDRLDSRHPTAGGAISAAEQWISAHAS